MDTNKDGVGCVAGKWSLLKGAVAKDMQYFKLQLSCLLIVLYVVFLYISEKQAYKVKKREPIFECLLVMGVLEIVFDGMTAWTVNNIDKVSDILNRVLHAGFLCSLDTFMFLMFLYIADITAGATSYRKLNVLMGIPYIVNIIIVGVFIPQLKWMWGGVTNYSMGISAYTCFIMVAVYVLAIVLTLLARRKALGRHKMITISTYIIMAIAVSVYQMANPQALITALAVTIVIVGTYLNMENPVLSKMVNLNSDMVMGFATLVENKDDNTGGHIKRTTKYVKLLAEALAARGYYREYLTNDYITNLTMAAPMHDIGKIAIPDSILQKPGKLTPEEYTLMKTHAARGGQIVRETFSSSGNDEYEKVAFEVATYHHERYNGTGYPEGRSGKDIPLSARIMAVADVFDAVSAKRCYRDALPLDECFSIIQNGSGNDFDPVIAQVFLSMKEEVERIHSTM